MMSDHNKTDCEAWPSRCNEDRSFGLAGSCKRLCWEHASAFYYNPASNNGSVRFCLRTSLEQLDVTNRLQLWALPVIQPALLGARFGV